MKLFKKLKLKYAGRSADGKVREEVVREDPKTALIAPFDTRHSTLPDRIAVLGDIHANLEALSAVLADIKAQGVSRIVCTGDIVGYAANPSECIKVVCDLNCPVVQGNHDSYASGDDNLGDFNLNAMNAILWTRKHLGGEEKMWLRNLPMRVALKIEDDRPEEEGPSELETTIIEPSPQGTGNEVKADALQVILVHSSMSDPKAWHYIMKPEKAKAELRVQEPDIVFFGHTHLPSVFSFNPQTEELVSKVPAETGVHHLETGIKHLINPGSVGQPRDHDVRASYAIYDPVSSTVEIRRVEYDISLVQKKIEAACLPWRNAERLEQGR